MRLVLLLSLLLVAPAGALTIQIDSVSLGPGNAADSPNNAERGRSALRERLGARRRRRPVRRGRRALEGSVFAGDAGERHRDWTITFTVTANPGVVYNVVIFQELAGAFSFLDDSPGDATGSVGEVTGTLAGLPNPLLTMPVGIDGAATSSTTASIPFQRSRLLELEAWSEPRRFTLGFAFAIDAQSATRRRGAARPAGRDAAAAYPGIGLRDAGADGHRLSLSTRVILAVPGALDVPLVVLGLVGLASAEERCGRWIDATSW